MATINERITERAQFQDNMKWNEHVHVCLRLGVLVAMTRRAGLPLEKTEEFLDRIGYPYNREIPDAEARELCAELTQALIGAGELAPDEDPLDAVLH